MAVVKAFRRLGIQGVGLKWPNDLQWHGRKLGGILIEMRGESAGPAQVIIGIGINMQMPAAIRMQLAEREAALIADVHEIMRDKTPTRNVLIGAVVAELLQMLQTFTVRGFAPFKDEWHELDTLANAPVKVISGSQIDAWARRAASSTTARCWSRWTASCASSSQAKSVCARRRVDGDGAAHRHRQHAHQVGTSGWTGASASSRPPCMRNWTRDDFIQQVLSSGPRAERVFIGNVGGKRMGDLARAAIAHAWQIEPRFVHSPAAQAGIRNAYPEPAQARRRSLAGHAGRQGAGAAARSAWSASERP